MQSLHSIFEYALGGLAFLAVITVLVFVHELGHYWLAKSCGMAVESFAIGIGGRRETDLTKYLKKPLMPARNLWIAAGACLIAMFLGSLLKVTALSFAGLTMLAVVLPVWVSGRIGSLYNLDLGGAYKTLAACWAAATAILIYANKGAGIEPMSALTVYGFASGLALILLYYRPVLNKMDESSMGHGQIDVGSEYVDVRFRPLISRKNKEGTEFSILAVPAGGFASIRGMAPKPDASETQVNQGFYSKSPMKRLIVLFAGPLFSILFGIALITALYSTVGEAQAVNKPIIGIIQKDSAATKAGLKVGDTIVSINGVKTETFFDIIRTVRTSANVDLAVEYERKGQIYKTTLTPTLGKEETPVFQADLEPSGETKKQGLAGMLWDSKFVQLSPVAAFQKGVALPFRMVRDLVNIAKQPSRAKNELGGPGTIAVIAVDAAKQGVTTVMLLAALLSISLGVMNLLPIYPLDGGQMVVAFIEMLRGGKRLSMQVQGYVSTSGFFLVLALAATMLAMDVNRFVGKEAKPKSQAIKQESPINREGNKQ